AHWFARGCWDGGPLAFTGCCYAYWAYAALTLPESRAQYFARGCWAGPLAFAGKCYLCWAYAVLPLPKKRAQYFARGCWAGVALTTRAKNGSIIPKNTFHSKEKK
ncbi:MAG: hypothetical protein LBI67_02570, partial [Treponema sp.]|nr:hypothetical protein [Treponema sp.]